MLALTPDGRLSAHKYLSENPDKYDDAAVYAIRDILDVAEGVPFPSDQVSAIKMGTTVATNALLERGGEPTCLLINDGFKDALLIGQQHREDLFALKPSRPAPLYTHVATIGARLDAQGDQIAPFGVQESDKKLQQAFDSGIRSIAIVLMHAHIDPAHERAAAAVAKKIGFTQITCSHTASAEMKFIPRGDTTVADAYLSPILHRYRDQVADATCGAELYFMQSSGGLTRADMFDGKDAVLSGPAGGIVGAASLGEHAGEQALIGFDMGGTSTDVCHYNGAMERVNDSVIAGVRLSVPMMDIHTVAAGGGSVCRLDSGRMLVGPESAGAYPGPACYGNGGPLTVTDCNLILGKIQPSHFPKIFGPDGKAPLDKTATIAAITATKEDAHMPESIETIAQGFLLIAAEHMARAIKKVSVARGHNVKKYALVTFGGAGGQHACDVASALGIKRVIIPPFAGMLSALGMGLANQRIIRTHGVNLPLESCIGTLSEIAQDLKKDAINALTLQRVAPENITCNCTVAIKSIGAERSLVVPYDTCTSMTEAFTRLHSKEFGFAPTGAFIVDYITAEATGGSEADLVYKALSNVMSDRQVLEGPQEMLYRYVDGKSTECTVYTRELMPINCPVNGPAIILENGSTITVEPGWHAILQEGGSLILDYIAGTTTTHIDASRADPILLEVFNNLFMSVAEEMGGVLAKTARSVNIKERLDFSCAVFDTHGELIANAPHMPVHLGSMGECVKAIISARSDIKPGDAFLANAPAVGGTHLPDITAITPVFLGNSINEPDYFVASRGHHADIGGLTPGSMPPNSRQLNEEGIRFENFRIVSAGHFEIETLEAQLASSKWPARDPDQNIADIKAQLAANARGATLVAALVDRYTKPLVDAYMAHIQNNAEDAVRAAVLKLQDSTIRYNMDCGGTIQVALKVNHKIGAATVDFTGTSDALSGNFNAPLAVTKAAVLYVFRTLTGADIPMNAGCMKPITLIVSDGCMLNPPADAAVVAGNVETSQAVTNALLMAAGASAASQGTMNNLTFGNARVQYYETIAGGTGAGPEFTGTDAIQSHMTNSRLTDPEVLEREYPVRLVRFDVRHGSGGEGRYYGGNGSVREIAFLDNMDVSILSSHRDFGPPGLDGGSAGKVGENIIVRRDGTTKTLKPSDQTSVVAGDRIIIKTPGGGGYGTV